MKHDNCEVSRGVSCGGGNPSATESPLILLDKFMILFLLRRQMQEFNFIDIVGALDCNRIWSVIFIQENGMCTASPRTSEDQFHREITYDKVVLVHFNPINIYSDIVQKAKNIPTVHAVTFVQLLNPSIESIGYFHQ